MSNKRDGSIRKPPKFHRERKVEEWIKPPKKSLRRKLYERVKTRIKNEWSRGGVVVLVLMALIGAVLKRY